MTRAVSLGQPEAALDELRIHWQCGIARRLPLRRNGTAADVAEAVLFFISESAGFLTGVALDVNRDSSPKALPGADE